MNQDVKEHSVAKSPAKNRNRLDSKGELPKTRKKTKGKVLQYKSKICKRSVARILSIVQAKMKHMVSLASGGVLSNEEISRAMSNPAAEQLLKR